MSEKRADSKTSELEASIRRAVREKLREALPQQKVHRNVKDHLNCPNCRPRFDKAMLDRGYIKPNLCPKHKTELVKPLLGDPFCPECESEKSII